MQGFSQWRGRGAYSRGFSVPHVRWLLPLALLLGRPSLVAAGLPSTIQRIVDKREVTNEEHSIYKNTMDVFGKYFATQEDDDHHEVDFVSNLRFIEEFNREGARKCILKITELTDLNFTEFQQERLGLLDIADDVKRRLQSDPERQHQPTSRSLADLPDTVDWERAGAVTSVKNQRSCGSCFAFATVAAIESAWKVVGGPLLDLSAQQVVDCTYRTAPYPSNMGCNGGYISTSLEYMKQTSTCTWESYPYSPSYGAVGSCKSSTCTVGVPAEGVTGWSWVSADMMHLMDAVSKRPVVVGIASSSSVFQNYGSGIVTAEDCGTRVDHAVLLVGYGTDSGTDYWRIKNTWGTSWGENGYVRIERGAGGSGGCGILTQAAYPTTKFTGYIPPGFSGDADALSPTPAPTPAPPPSSSDDDDDDDGGSSGGSTAAIIAASVIGGVVLVVGVVAAGAVAAWFFCLPGEGGYATMLVSMGSILRGGPDSSTSQQLFQCVDDCEASDANE